MKIKNLFKTKSLAEIKKYPNGEEDLLQFEWSKGIDNIQPITQTQNNSSITTGNKKLSTEEISQILMELQILIQKLMIYIINLIKKMSRILKPSKCYKLLR
jgi:pantothenate kinase